MMTQMFILSDWLVPLLWYLPHSYGCDIYLCNGLLSPHQITNSLYTWHCIPSTYHSFSAEKTLSTYVGLIDSCVLFRTQLLWWKLISRDLFLNNITKLLQLLSNPTCLPEDINQIFLYIFIDLV